MVYGSQFCGSNDPDLFCSVFKVNSGEACSIPQGSPVICGNGSGIQGFVTSNQTCQLTGDSFQLNYLSVQSFVPWIDQVFSSYYDSIDSRDYLVRIYEITNEQSLIRTRCVGTVIGPHHILTTASCLVDTKNIIGVEGKFSDRLHSYMTGLL